jgi:hypothetical protein
MKFIANPPVGVSATPPPKLLFGDVIRDKGLD